MLRNLVKLSWLASLTLAACTTASHVPASYSSLHNRAEPTSGKTTTVLFLIDGLSVRVLKKALRHQAVPNLRRHFDLQGDRFAEARTTFPSLTFPSLASLLTRSGIDQHGVYGNSVWRGPELLELEKPTQYRWLNQHLRDRSLFAALAASGQTRTISLSFSFAAGAESQLPIADADAGWAILTEDYWQIDQKILTGLQQVLTATSISHWPDFVFVHLIGVDFLSHRDGPDSSAVESYLDRLDHAMASTLTALREATAERKVVTILTADHGFDREVEKVSHMEVALRTIDRHIQVINESRFLALRFPDAWNLSRQTDLLRSISRLPEVELAANRQGALFTENGPVPRLTSELHDYFAAQESPDAVILARSGVAFKEGSRGQHGGATDDERHVPLLLRGARLTTQTRPPLSQLLLHLQ